MNNNDVLRRIRYIFDFADTKIVQIFSLVDVKIESKDVTRWLKKEDDPWILDCKDEQLATFLNGLIVSRRGKKEGPPPVPEKVLNNNIILRKLKIALDYKSDDMLEILALADVTISEHELSAFFRKEGHKHYRECQNQILRNFLEGLRIKFRPSE
jgi:uncharacterized protein YehS (DUF1456 family)